MADKHQYEVTKTDGTKAWYDLSDEQHKRLSTAADVATVISTLIALEQRLIKGVKYVGKVK